MYFFFFENSVKRTRCLAIHAKTPLFFFLSLFFPPRLDLYSSFSMKAVLQVGPAQFIVDGATFHLLCSDIQQTLQSFMPLSESEIFLTLHIDALERCLADDAQRLASAGVPPPRALHDLESIKSIDSTQQMDRRANTRGAMQQQRRRLSVSRVCEPINVFSVDSFDAAEAVVQELHARVLEQRLLLEKCVEQGTIAPEVEENVTAGKRSGSRVGGSVNGAAVSSSPPRRALPLPLLRLDTYLSTSADVLPEYDAQGRRRRRLADNDGNCCFSQLSVKSIR